VDGRRVFPDFPSRGHGIPRQLDENDREFPRFSDENSARAHFKQPENRLSTQRARPVNFPNVSDGPLPHPVLFPPPLPSSGETFPGRASGSAEYYAITMGHARRLV